MRMRSGAGRITVAMISAVIAALCVGVSPGVAKSSKPAKKPRLSISVLSGRADLVSGGNALVAITLPNHSAAKQVKITLRGRNIRGSFAFRQDGRFEGVVRPALGRACFRMASFWVRHRLSF